jgi:hypothetical protein
MTALEKRAEAIATDLDHSTLPYFPDRAAAQIRALLAAHKECKRELAACKRCLRIERDVEGLSGASYEILERAKVKL